MISSEARRRMRSLPVALFAFAILLIEQGVPLHSPVLDAAILLLGVVFLFSIILPDLKKYSLYNRMKEDKWISLFSLIFFLLMISCLILSLAGKMMEGKLPDIIKITSKVYVILVSLKVIISSLGKWFIDRMSPAAVLPATFIVVIVTGSFLLMLPAATTVQISPLNSVFTAASATCVTGLIVQNTGQDFSTFGQAIILFMIQVGGLGLMTFVAFFALFLGHSIGLKESFSLSRVMESEFVSDLKRVLGHIIVWTLSIEAAGAVMLYSIWRPMNQLQQSNVETIWDAVFHSVSAFCNAGFSLNADNLESFSSSSGTILVVGSLIVLGGLGFSVLAALSTSFVKKLRGARSGLLPIHVKLVLVTTFALILATIVFFLLFEWNNTLKEMSFGLKMSNAFLESVTPRTAGFNSVPTAELTPAVKWIFTVLMFIGASPGGTGGGIKTITFALLILGTISLFRHKPSVEVWKRRISFFDIKRALAVFLLSSLVFFTSVTLLLVSEKEVYCSDASLSTSDYLFEAMSAFGTVGLSTGVTGKLTPIGRIVIITTMFLGRIGPLTLAIAAGRPGPERYMYPETRVTIG